MTELTPKERLERAHKILHNFQLTDDQLRELMTILDDEFQRGLRGDPTGSVKMLVTYVRDVPSGKEVGEYMALDLGGTNFRVLMITLKGDEADIDQETCEVDAKLMIGPGKDLFDHIANCVYKFIADRKIKLAYLPIGFTFSFPCQKVHLASAKLLRWTKGFKCSNVVGEDIVALMKTALRERRPKDCKTDVDIVAVINDTTGTLMSCAHRNRNCRIGLILGTGTNLCYMEKLERVVKWDHPNDRDPPQVAINTEWGAFGDNGRLAKFRTPWDDKVDEESLNPTMQLFEKMISGMYLGEITRHILISLHGEGIIFPGSPLPDISQPRTFSAKHLSRIASNQPQATEKVFLRMKCQSHDDADLEIMRFVCSKVVTRAANLVSAGIACVLQRFNDQDHLTIGYDGSVLRYHPTIKKEIVSKLGQLSSHKFDLILSEDGSGRGAALVAAVACSDKEKNKV